MKQSKTVSYAYDLTQGGHLILYAQEPVSDSIIARRINALLQWLGTPKDFYIVLWWRDDPRHMPATYALPNRRQVNGGWATPGTNTIFIYRSEEFDRVLIHETIHALEWDWVMPSRRLPCWNFKNSDIISPHLFEAWTELYAEWLYCGWHNISWEDQQRWQLFQAVQIMARYAHMKSWKEDTNIFAYYILKAALAPHIGFIWVAENGATPEERMHVLCSLTKPILTWLREQAVSSAIQPFSLRMTVGKK